MASSFLYLEDGRAFAPRFAVLASMLDLIHQELKSISGAEEFAKYLAHFVPDKNDEPNGYGGFVRSRTGENIMLSLDLREFAKANRTYFWKAAQAAVDKLIRTNGNEILIPFFKTLLDMHKRIEIGEKPELLNHMKTVEPETGMKKGPGWE